MYEEFYGFEKKPFSMLADPDCIYLGRQHRKALSMLEYGVINNNGFVVLTGASGSGKTTLLRHLQAQREEGATVAFISSTRYLETNLLAWILMAFEQEYRGKSEIECYQALQEFFELRLAHGRPCLLILDEAQCLSPVTFEELRQLSNLTNGEHWPFQLILAGNEALDHTLKSVDLAPFAQRIGIDYHLGSFSELETVEYITWWLRYANGDTDLFSPAASRTIYAQSRGIPRLINRICDLLLLHGYVEGAKKINLDFTRRAIAEPMSGT